MARFFVAKTRTGPAEPPTTPLTAWLKGDLGPLGPVGVGEVPAARSIGTTGPLTGGGDLSANRTIAITAATALAAGSMSASDKTKLDGISGDQFTNVTSSRIIGRVAAGFGPAEELTGIQATALLSLATSTLQGAMSAADKKKLDAVAVSVKEFGTAVGTGGDDTAAFQAAAAASRAIYVPAGTYLVNGTTNLSIDGASWHGDGINATTIRSTNASLPIFTIAAGLSGVSITDMALDRSVIATAGGDGIKCNTVSIGQAYLKRLKIQKQNVGLALGPTDWSEVEKVIVQNCQSAGVTVSNTATDGACQWSFDTVLSQMNGGQGFLVQCIAGPAQMTVGTFKNCATFGNTGVGAAFVGLAAVPLQGLRIVGGFYGESGNHEIYLDTFGDQHMITGAFVELAGRRTTGPTLATPASGTGHGILATANNGSIQITGVHSAANSLDGFNINATSNQLTGCRAQNNGLSVVAGSRSGATSTTGRLVVTGGNFGNTGAGASQQYGVSIANGANLSVTGADLNSNSVASILANTNAKLIQALGNLPATANKTGRVSVKDYGATGNGATDDTAAIQAAINAVFNAGGGEVKFPPGTFKYTSLSLLAGESVALVGEGRATILTTSLATGDTITVACDMGRISNLRLTSIPVRTAGAYAAMVGPNSLIENCFIDGDFIGIKLTGVGSKARFNTFSNAVAGAKRIWASGGDTSQSVIGNLMHHQATPVPLAGVFVDDSSALKILSNDIVGQGSCILIQPGTGQNVFSVYAADNFLDTSLVGLSVNPTGTGGVYRCKFHDNWAGSHSVAGVYLEAPVGGVIDGIEWAGGDNNLNNNGIAIIGAGTINVNIVGGSARQNSGSAVSVGDNVTKFKINGLQCQPAAGWTANANGIFLGLSVDQYEIRNCDVSGQTASPIANHIGWSTGRRVSRNKGYTTENSGSTLIASGGTSVVVSHGLSRAPRGQDILIVPTSGQTSSAPLYIDTTSITATQFTVRTTTAAASNLDFIWKIAAGDN